MHAATALEAEKAESGARKVSGVHRNEKISRNPIYALYAWQRRAGTDSSVWS